VITYEGETVAAVLDPTTSAVITPAINTTGLKGVWTTLEG
jgi:hypothetical protein